MRKWNVDFAKNGSSRQQCYPQNYIMNYFGYRYQTFQIKLADVSQI